MINELNNAMEQIRNEYYSINPNDPNAPGSNSGESVLVQLVAFIRQCSRFWF